MDSLWSYLSIGNIPVPVLAVLLLCVVGIIASGKPAETFGRLAACAASYCLAAAYGPNLFSEDPARIKISLEGIPFYNNVILKGNGSVLSLFFSDFAVFAKEFLKLFIFSLVVDMFFTVFKSLVDYCKTIKRFGLGYFLPWLARYTICVFAMFAYIALYVFALAPMPDKLWFIMSIIIIIVTALMLLTPLIEYIIVWIDLIPNKAIKALSEFIKEHKMGGVLQVAFFAAFSFAAVIICLQEAFPGLVKGLF